MFMHKVLLASLAAAALIDTSVAQQPPAPATTTQTTTAATSTDAAPSPEGGVPAWIKPETAEQRHTRLGTAEDPGLDPDPNKHFWRFGRSYHIEKFDRFWAVYDQPAGFVRPYAPLNVAKEIYQQNDKWVWVWMPDYKLDDLMEKAKSENTMSRQQIEMYQQLRTEFTALDVPESGKTIRFEESSDGLPRGGSYRNSLAIADINEDGCPDIVTPPQRGGNGVPEIYLGDCKGHWKGWATTTWPYRMDYGSVVAADFNKDGHMDLAFGVHLNGVRVLLGDGKGHFVDSSAGIGKDFPTRRVVVADVNHDGYPDIVALSEGPAAAMMQTPAGAAKMRVYINHDKARSWEAQNVSQAAAILGGDWLTVAKFNNDSYPDFVAASVYFNGSDILWASTGKAQWRNVGSGTLVPLQSIYFANTAGHFSSKKLDDAVVSYVRTWPDALDPQTVPPPDPKNISGIDRITFTGKEPVRTPIIRWTGSRPIWGLAAADLDGDGNVDLIFTQPNPRTVDILLGDGNGKFRHANVVGLPLASNTNYDIKVADVNGDGRPDIILAYESTELTAFAPRNGSVHVYLNRGVTEAPKEAEK